MPGMNDRVSRAILSPAILQRRKEQNKKERGADYEETEIFKRSLHRLSTLCASVFSDA